jgi:hypothetical protein
MANWYKQLMDIDPTMTVAVYKDGIAVVVPLIEAKEVLDVEFDSGFGGIEGQPFTGWTKDLVYFPTAYDGAEGMHCVPRNPCTIVTYHVGE